MVSATNSVVEEVVQRWLDDVVIGLNLCPFARQPSNQGSIETRVINSAEPKVLAVEIEQSLRSLEEKSAEELETILVVTPNMLLDFAQYNQFLGVLDHLLVSMDWEGIFQIASFHPEYQFAGTSEDDVSNWTNRAPYPVFHLLREESITRAVDSLSDPDEIYERNMQKMESLSSEQRRTLFPWLHKQD